jgi:hypothetical protein
MTRTTHYGRTGALPAIAAALALSSTPVLAQAIQPTEPTTSTSPVSVDPPPVSTESSPTTPATSDSSPVTNAPLKTSSVKTRTVTHTTRVASAKSAPPKTRTTTTRTASTQVNPAPEAPPPPASGETSTSQSSIAPVVDLTSSAARKPAANAANSNEEMLPIAGGALALVALCGIAFAASRRRRDAEAWHGDWADETEAEREAAIAAPAAEATGPRHDLVSGDEQSKIVAPSAFAWGATAPPQRQAERDSGDDRLPGETWIQRAHRGPSASNPSVSLKNRLRRAAFFDKRERDVAAGIAEPVDADAGLPGAMTEVEEGELA